MPKMQSKIVKGPYVLSRSERKIISYLAKAVVDWSRSGGRIFPWRQKEANLFNKIVTEVLLQRTRAETISDFYHQFFSRYQDWHDLAHAHQDELEKILRPIGLWKRRAKSLIALAKYAAEREGAFPRNQALHSPIPAVGQYVSNAVVLFQNGERRALLDVNMARIIERYIHPRSLSDIRYDPWLQEASSWLVRTGDPVQINWAILDFGALICRARDPRCGECPLNQSCNFRKELSLAKLNADQPAIHAVRPNLNTGRRVKHKV